MKKVLSLILAALMVFSILPAAFAADTTSAYQDAIDSLASIGLMKGYDNGDFGGKDLVERYQMAILAARFQTGKIDGAYWAAIENTATFTDLAGFDGYSAETIGAISYASEKGIVNGTGNNKFEPNGKVIYQDAITMIVRAMGYTGLEYPDGYMAKAAELHLTDNVTGVGNEDNATREVIAELLYRALIANNGSATLTTNLATFTMDDMTGIKFGGNNAEYPENGNGTIVADPTDASNNVLQLTKTQAGTNFNANEHNDNGRAAVFTLCNDLGLSDGDFFRVSMRLYVGDDTTLVNDTNLRILSMTFLTQGENDKNAANLYMPLLQFTDKTKTAIELVDNQNNNGANPTQLYKTIDTNKWYTFAYDFTISGGSFKVVVSVDGEEVATSTNYFHTNDADPVKFADKKLTLQMTGYARAQVNMLVDDITVDRVATTGESEKSFTSTVAKLTMDSAEATGLSNVSAENYGRGYGKIAADPTDASNNVLMLDKTVAGNKTPDDDGVVTGGYTTTIKLCDNLGVADGQTFRVSMDVYVASGLELLNKSQPNQMKILFQTGAGDLYMPTIVLDEDAKSFYLCDYTDNSNKNKTYLGANGEKQSLAFDTWYTFTFEFTITGSNFSVVTYVNGEKQGTSTNCFGGTLNFSADTLKLSLQPQMRFKGTVYFDDITVERVSTVG